MEELANQEADALANEAALPSGWAWTTLATIANVLRGVTYSKADAQTEGGTNLTSILRAHNIQDTGLDLQSNLVFVPDTYITAEQYLKPLDIVVCMSSGSKHLVGKAAQLTHGWRGSFGAFCAGIRVDDALDARYVGYFLRSETYRSFIRLQSLGVNINNLRRGDLEGLMLPLAPLNEQRRIVAAIEAQFTRLDAGVAALKRLQANLKRYKASVLKTACEGKLVPQNAQDEPAAALLARILAERRAKWEAEQRAKGKDPAKLTYPEPAAPDTSDLPDLPDRWVWATVDQLTEVVRGASPRPAGDPKYFGGDIPWILVGSLTADDGPYLTSVSQFVTEEGKNASRYVEPETLLLTNSGATLGVPKITKIGGCINDGSVALLHVDNPLKLYLYYVLATMTQKLRALNQGAAQPNLNTGIVKQILVPLPPLKEQERIIEAIENALSLAHELSDIVNNSRHRAERLRQSILKEAFAGRLVPQDADDEPASELLARIRRERAARKGQLL